MIQLNILSGQQAGTHQVARRFPFRVGRAAGNELQLADDGVWDQHLTLAFQPQSGFNLATSPNALVTVNGEPVQNITLRNGDLITVGSVKLQFWLAAARQGSLRVREVFVWALLALVTLGQFCLLYWLLGKN
jgi:pSer/pThr/pTyr-binding forkhead associated (FHA) protein